MSIPQRITPPAELPVTLAHVKSHSAIDFDDDDALLTSLIQAATGRLDGFAGLLGRCLVTQRWQIRRVMWTGIFLLPFPDCSNVAVNYIDVDGIEQSVDAALFETMEDALGTTLIFKRDFTRPAINQDTTTPISIAFDAGYGAASAVPDTIKTAITLMVQFFYEQRGQYDAASHFPSAVYHLIEPHRRTGVF